MWAPTRALCALCEQRFMRSSLPGVVVMKRVYDVRRRWGVIQDSKKFHAPSLLYGTANVEQTCSSILDRMRMIHDSIMHRWHQQPPSRSNDSNLDDIAVNKRVRQSSTVCSMKAQNALDPDINRTAHTKEELQPWWEIDLGNYVEVHSVKVYLRDEVSRLYTAARDLAANPGRHTSGVYPLHICISMRSGIGRDCGDIVASSVSSLCVTDKVAPLIEWVAPQKSRGRFVRIQSEGRAVLHIERVQVFEAKAVIDPVVRRQHFRQKLQRAAICASALATTVTPLTKSSRVAVSAANQSVNKAESEYQPPSASFFDPDRAEKKRMSRLYTRFKSLLDARAKYYAPEKGADEEEEGENPL
ncbi:hypothetical protein PHMEG_00018675 [Phytophthora megakarya]|uniref:Fucolectin tachylectin-4 pentraxin-1 domain-containing protein n=1 Tax=Phytophthora megakarya TaxID=4795 RepID=A0A225VTS9_9STRA|nr:hypothetical protein PHMEG_00018675 [Phytophthora megakarya]